MRIFSGFSLTHQQWFCLFLIGVSLTSLGFFKKNPPEGDLQRLYLAPSEEIEHTQTFKAVLLAKDSETREKAKIEYLLNRVRFSKHTFIRNGESHKGKTAAMLLSHKYKKYKAESKTLYDFVFGVASGSRTSGKPYRIKIEGKSYPVHEIFKNEIRILEEKLLKTPVIEPLARKPEPEPSHSLLPSPAPSASPEPSFLPSPGAV